MRGARASLLGLAIAVASAAAAREPPRGLVGLVTPTQVADGPPGCTRVDTKQKRPLYSGPSTQAPRIGWLVFAPWREDSGECEEVQPLFEATTKAGRTPVPSLESDYEVLALAVLRREGDWLQIDLGPGSGAGWLQRPPGYRFDPYPALLVGRLAYATPAWRGELCAAPGIECRTLEATAEQPLTVHAVDRRDGAGWLEVELTTDPCRGDAPLVLHRGWIRAAADKAPTAWFHSRGC